MKNQTTTNSTGETQPAISIGVRAAAWSARCDCRNGHKSNSGRCGYRDVTDPTRYADENGGFAACPHCRENCPCGSGDREVANTPGPWHVQPDSRGGWQIYGAPMSRDWRLYYNVAGMINSKVDAALIARAPAMLAEIAALRGCRDELLAALERLTVVATSSLAGTYNGRMGDFHRDCGDATELARAAIANAERSGK